MGGALLAADGIEPRGGGCDCGRVQFCKPSPLREFFAISCADCNRRRRIRKNKRRPNFRNLPDNGELFHLLSPPPCPLAWPASEPAHSGIFSLDIRTDVVGGFVQIVKWKDG